MNKPQIGMIYIHAGKRCKITKVRPHGTIDIQALDGSGSWRITGLWF